MTTIEAGYPDDVPAIMESERITAGDCRDIPRPATKARPKGHAKLRFLYLNSNDFESLVPGAMLPDARYGPGPLGKPVRSASVTGTGQDAWLLAFFFHMFFRVLPRAETDAAPVWVLERSNFA